MRKVFISISIMLLAVLSGCSSKMMDPVLIPDIPQDKQASITFFRTSLFGGTVQAPIAEEVQDGNLNLVGICSTDTKIRYFVSPGRHIFVVGGESGSLLEAEIAPNMNYYVRVVPRIGWFKNRFEMVGVTPQDLATQNVQEEIKKCTLVKPNEAADQWFVNNQESMKNKLQAAKEKFQKRSDSSRYVLPENFGISEVY